MSARSDPAATGAVLALDLGTTSAKAALIGLGDGGVLATSEAPYPTRLHPGGGAEQDPADWMDAARAVIVECLTPAPTSAAPHHAAVIRPVAIGLTGQMQDLILLGDSPGRHLAPAILYTDMRAAEDVAALQDALPAWHRIAGNLQDATSTAAALRRIARVQPDLRARTRQLAFGPSGFLAHALGCGAACDPTTASTTGLLDLRRGAWSPEMLGVLDLDPALLPRLTAGVIGRTGLSAEALLGLPSDVPIVLAPGDAAATTLGTVGLQPGADYVYLGTSGWLAQVMPGPAADPSGGSPEPGTAAHRLALPDPSSHLRVSAVLAAGGAAEWARNAFLGGVDPAEADTLLIGRWGQRGRSPSGLLALPSLQGERFPVRDPDLRAAVVGIDADTRPVDLYAAVLEGVAHALAHGMDTGDGTAGSAPLVVTGGGARSAPWCQVLADVTGRPVRVPPSGEISAAVIGAAIWAADAVGVPHGIRPLGWHEGEGARIVAPDPEAALAHAAQRPRHRALYDVLGAPGGASIKS